MHSIWIPRYGSAQSALVTIIDAAVVTTTTIVFLANDKTAI